MHTRPPSTARRPDLLLSCAQVAAVFDLPNTEHLVTWFLAGLGFYCESIDAEPLICPFELRDWLMHLQRNEDAARAGDLIELRDRQAAGSN